LRWGRGGGREKVKEGKKGGRDGFLLGTWGIARWEENRFDKLMALLNFAMHFLWECTRGHTRGGQGKK